MSDFWADFYGQKGHFGNLKVLKTRVFGPKCTKKKIRPKMVPEARGSEKTDKNDVAEAV